jgi:phage shock protein PspC (stress-responsive transcriptional regulator)
MNKILNINLGGYALTIDDDAYEYLQAYLESIRRRFRESEGRDEILSDIEARLGELISQSMGGRSIVMLPDVEAAASVMGKPEDFGEETNANTTHQGHSRTGAQGKTPSGGSSIRTGKRLFRDEEDSVVGGVCSGLAAYFGIADPVWMRIIFVLLSFASFGFWMPAYVLLWILVPPAKTAADRLAMRGEPANVDNIAREIEEGFERLSKKVNEYGSDGGKSANHAVNTGVNALGQMFGFMLRFIGKFGVLILFLIGIALLIALGLSWVAGIWSLFVAAPYMEYFSPYSNGMTWFGLANAFFLLAVPALGLCLMFAKVLFRTKTPAWLGRGLTLFWVLNVISAFALASFVARDYRHSGTVTTDVDLSGLRSDTLRVEGLREVFNQEFDDFLFDEEGIRIGNNRMEINGPLEIRVRRSNTGQFRCTQIVKAQGPSNLKAQENASQVDFLTQMAGNTLRVPTAYSIEKGKKWRLQRIRINIEVPEGKYIVFDEKIYKYAGADLDDYADGNGDYYISHEAERMFQMSGDGLRCVNCPTVGDRDYRGGRRYENFILEGDFSTEIREGKNFRVEIEGPADLRNAIQKIESGDNITFTTNGKPTNGSVRILITAPVFTSLYADKSSNVTIRGFDEGIASISAKEDSRIRAFLDVSERLSITLSGKANLELSGKGGDLEATLSGDAQLEASNWRAKDAEVYASDNAKARVYARSDAQVNSTGNSAVKVDGNAGRN